MAHVLVFDMTGSNIGEMELNDDIFAYEVNDYAVHASVVQYLANQRQGTKGTKTRAEVSGGGRKPWRQKGTGHARQGSIRSPQWKGGGVVFAPKARDYSIKLNKKVKRIALKSALSDKVSENKLIVIDEIKLDAVKTKEMKKVMDNFKFDKALICLGGSEQNIVLSARNLPNVKTAAVNTINVYDILKHDVFIATKDAINKIQEVYA